MKKWVIGLFVLASCTSSNPKLPAGTFGHDVDFLRARDTGLVILGGGDEQVVVSPKYQGKVFTSTDSGSYGRSFGWIHYSAFDGPVNPHMNAYGGENRLWLGPEGGIYSLFFPPGAKMEFANWKTPAAFDTAAWGVIGRSDSSVELRKEMRLLNYVGDTLEMKIDRAIMLLKPADIERSLSISRSDSVMMVGYSTFNVLTNTGNFIWANGTGMPCLWLLDMFNPSPATTIIIPFHSEQGDTSKPATTDYFGEIPADRIKIRDSVIFFTADGKNRGKLGVHPSREKSMIGSYDAVGKVLTITAYDTDRQARYLNQEWNTVKPPFSGDAVNAYNDGPLAGGGQMGPFYELESVSPAAFLAPGQSLTHRHSVYHFTGPEEALDSICQKLLGVSVKGLR